MEFVEDTLVPLTIGGVLQGMSFSSGSFMGQDWPLVEVIRLLLYPYVKPELNLTVSNLSLSGDIYAEVDVSSLIGINYSVTRFSNDISSYKVEYQLPLTNVLSGTYSGLPGTGVSSSTSVSVVNSVANSEETIDFILSVSDNLSLSFSHSSTASIHFVNPIYYGFTSSIISLSSDLNTFVTSSDKLIQPYATQSYYEAEYDGSGYLYFIYPVSFGDDLSEIKDPNGLIIHDENSLPFSAFTHSVVSRTVPFGVNYNVWRTTYTTSYDGPGSFKFKF